VNLHLPEKKNTWCQQKYHSLISIVTMRVNLFLMLFIPGLMNACNNGHEKTGGAINRADSVHIKQDTPAGKTIQEPDARPFNKEVSYKSIRFLVSSPGTVSDNRFTITPSGLSIVNNPATIQISGMVTDLVTDDIDGDDSPEVAVIVQTGNSSKAYVFSANRNKSMSEVNFPELTDAKLLAGYNGEDEFNFVEGSFIRRFPLFDGAVKTGKMRQVQYKLKTGEALKQLVFERASEF
jgi:hypothetical protein